MPVSTLLRLPLLGDKRSRCLLLALRNLRRSATGAVCSFSFRLGPAGLGRDVVRADDFGDMQRLPSRASRCLGCISAGATLCVLGDPYDRTI